MKKSGWKKALEILTLIIIGVLGGVGGSVNQFEKGLSEK